MSLWSRIKRWLLVSAGVAAAAAIGILYLLFRGARKRARRAELATARAQAQADDLVAAQQSAGETRLAANQAVLETAARAAKQPGPDLEHRDDFEGTR